MIRSAPMTLALAFVVAACSPPPLRYDVPVISVSERQAIAFSSVEVMTVSLPSYASDETILTRDAAGALVEDRKAVWADDPSRAMTLELVRHIGTISGAKVASDPWPFQERAAARLEVRVEEFSTQTGGVLSVAGQYFVASESGTADRSRRFSLSESWDVAGGYVALANARARLTADLAQEIVANGLR